MTFADHILSYISSLDYVGSLPGGIRIMNPFRENPEILPVCEQFYYKFYSDHATRRIILGINPGRLGAGATGIPFTDTKRLREKCDIHLHGFQTHEPSSVFVYEMIEAFGGPAAFYSEYYISSMCPLGFTSLSKTGKEVNYNYYDNAELENAVRPFMIESLEKQLAFGLDRSVALCFGTGKNFKYIDALNQEHRWFKEIIPLEHPRYIVQYKSKQTAAYITKYLTAFSRITTDY